MKSRTKRNQFGAAIALVSLIAATAQVQADQVKADRLSIQGGSINTTPSLGGGAGSGTAGKFTFDREALSSGVEFSGILNSDGGPTGLTGSDDVFYAFCLEPNETLIDPHTYDVVDLKNAPVSGVSGTMGSANAEDLKLLFGNVLPDFSASISTQTAIALQIAVWEIANEGSQAYDVDGGNFVVNDRTTERGIAQGWLANIMDGTWTTKAQGLVGLVDTATGAGQDFVAQVVPIPAAAWLFGSAIVGVAALGRRRRKEEEVIAA